MQTAIGSTSLPNFRNIAKNGLQTRHKCKNNGAVNLLCCLKNFILCAIRNEWGEKNPFRYDKMRVDKTNVKVPLTKAKPNVQLKRLMPMNCWQRATGGSEASVQGGRVGLQVPFPSGTTGGCPTIQCDLVYRMPSVIGFGAQTRCFRPSKTAVILWPCGTYSSISVRIECERMVALPGISDAR